MISDMPNKRKSTRELIEGEVFAEDVLTPDGRLVVPSGTIATAKVISKIRFYAVPFVYVSEAKAQKMEEVEKKNEESYYRKVVGTSGFKRFNLKMKSSIYLLQNFIDKALQTNEEINTQEIVDIIDSIIKDSGNAMHLFTMMQCIRSYDDIMYVHSVNVALICNTIADWLHMSEEDKRDLTVAALLSDIGKLTIDKKILTKSSKLTDEEYEIIKRHTIKGYDLVKDKNLSQRVKYTILQHHERCDGSGYPYGLMSKDIIDFAKIVGMADVYDAMTANRVYRQGICPFDVIDTFEKEGYQKYDPKFLLPFLERISQCYVNKEVVLSNGKKAEVILLNKNHLARPVVKVDDKYIDLAEVKDISIKAIY